MDVDLLATLGRPENRQLRQEHRKEELTAMQHRLLADLENTLKLLQLCLNAQCSYDVDDYYSLMLSTYPDARTRPYLSLCNRVIDRRVDIFWATFRRAGFKENGEIRYFCKRIPKGTKSEKQAMRYFNRQPPAMKKIIALMEQRNCLKRQRSQLISTLFQVADKYCKLLDEDGY